ncbi:MAG: hypothetical protein WC516_05190 [Patescibacteria group bacterium]|jgi:hypothetical protein
MKSFRIDLADGGFILRELHPDPKSENRKYGAAKTKKQVIRIIKKWLDDMKFKE